MPLFTAANARAMGARGIEARRRNLAQRAAALLHPPPPLAPPPIDPYVVKRLARVRHQLDDIDTAIARESGSPEPDGRRLCWLAQAQERLAEQERVLAGRPLPGSRRPTSDKPPPAPMTAEPITPTPTPEP